MRRQKTLNLIGTILACGLAIFSKPLVKKITDGFTISSIQSVFPSDPLWNTTNLTSPQTIDEILKKKFRYLAKGAQCYVFLSEDKEHILKFFNQPLYKKKGVAERNLDFTSYKIAYENFLDETGLIDLHLSPTPSTGKKIILIDPSNIEHCIDREPLEYLLQKHVELAIPALTQAMENQREEAAKKHLEGLFQLIERRLSKGIVDRDADIIKNFGFLKDNPVQIDTGRFRFASSADDFKADLNHFKSKNKKFAQWLETTYPLLYVQFQEQMGYLEETYNQKIEIK